MNNLHNCPNCGGYLNDHGRCEFCGSKVYDFCDIDLSSKFAEKPIPTYLRMKTSEGIWVVPVMADICSVHLGIDSYTPSSLGYGYFKSSAYPEIELHFIATGDGTYERNEV